MDDTEGKSPGRFQYSLQPYPTCASFHDICMLETEVEISPPNLAIAPLWRIVAKWLNLDSPFRITGSTEPPNVRTIGVSGR